MATRQEYEFQYTPLEGRLPGSTFEQQTEDAINDIGNRVANAEYNSETAIENSETAMQTAQEAKNVADDAETTAENAQASADTANDAIAVINNTLAEIDWTQSFTDENGVLYQKLQGIDLGGVEEETLSETASRAGQTEIANAIRGLSLELLSNNVLPFSNVAKMKETDVPVGSVAVTKGYYAVNDGGAGLYIIRAAVSGETYDNGSLILLDNGNVAELINDGVVLVKQFGVKADGVTDDTIPLQKALDFGKAKKIKIVGLNLEIHTTKTIFIDYDCDFTDTVLYVDSSTLTNDRGYSISPAVAVGMNTSINTMNSTIPSVTNTNVAVGTFDVGIGVFLGSCYDCNLKLQSYRYFEVGIWMAGYTSGCAYNSIFVDQAVGCKIGLKMYPYDSTSYVTENNIYGGRYTQNKTVSDVTDSRLISVCSSNNVLYKPCVEANPANVEYPIEFKGSANLIIAPRLEGMTKVYYSLFGNNLKPSHNIIIAPYDGYNILNIYDPNITNIDGIGNTMISPGSIDLIGTLKSCLALQTNYIDTPAVIGYRAGAMNQQNLDINNTDWCFKFYTHHFDFKAPADTYPRISLHWHYGGRIHFGSGSAEHDCEIAYAFGRLNVSGVPFSPWSDNNLKLGTASNRWSEVFAGTGTINTSDEREKQDIAPIDDAVFRAWSKVNFVQYRFRDAVSKKGDKARIHFGLIAQQVKEAFESEGLDAFDYGLLCYDEWEDEYEDVEVIDVEEVRNENDEVVTPQQSHTEKHLVNAAGNRYGIRYDEALALECAYQRWINQKA